MPAACGHPAEDEEKEDERGRENGVDQGNSARAAAERNRRKQQPQQGWKRPKREKQRIERRKHGSGRDEGTERDENSRRGRRPFEEFFKRAAKSPVFLPQPQKEHAHAAKEHGRCERAKERALRPEESDELGARNKSRADGPSHDETCALQDSHRANLCLLCLKYY